MGAGRFHDEVRPGFAGRGGAGASTVGRSASRIPDGPHAGLRRRPGFRKPFDLDTFSISERAQSKTRGPTFDAVAAVRHAERHARPSSIGQGARYTRQAIEAGGLIVRPVLRAKDYGASLVQAGFREISIGVSGPFLPGDVAVIQPHSKQDGASGHMQIFTGKVWVSDFQQRDGFWPSNRPTSPWKVERPRFKIYRFPGLVSARDEDPSLGGHGTMPAGPMGTSRVTTDG